MSSIRDADYLGVVLPLIAAIAVVVALGIQSGCTEEPVRPVVLTIGDGAESLGNRIVDIIKLQGGARGAQAAVAEWLKAHPGYRVEALAPADYDGGGNAALSLTAYLIVATKE